MTWKVKVGRGAFALGIVGTLAIAAGADWIELARFFWFW